MIYDKIVKLKCDLYLFNFFKKIKNLVDKTLEGYNSTALAYGVTGTGKTHTMFGNIKFTFENSKEQNTFYLNTLKNVNYDFPKIINSQNNSCKVNDNQFGICIYAIDYLFKKIKEINIKSFNSNNSSHSNIQDKDKINILNNEIKSFSINLTYLEIYNEQVIDLLSDKKEKPESLLILEDPNKGICVPDITQHKITDVSQVINLILIGNSRRTMAPTSANQFSSRSHAILEFNIEQINLTTEITISSKLCLVDLAGSERGGLEKGVRREEGSNINKSLLALGNCINILSDKTKKNNFVPYRDSKLTRLLKDSLSGNISTILIACISPSISSYDETLNTLKYASRARNIEKTICKNIYELDGSSDLNNYKEIINKLKNELFSLKDVIK